MSYVPLDIETPGASAAGLGAALRTASRFGDAPLATTGVSTVVGVDGAGAIVRGTTAFVNVKNYDPVGDGTTNDTAAFTAAKTAGGVVFVPKPTTSYTFPSPVTTDSSAWLPDPTVSWSNLTDAGKLDLSRGFFTDQLDGGNIWRFADRVFVGQAASKFAGNFSTLDAGNSSFSSDVDSVSYLGINAQFLSMTGGAAGAGGNSGGYAVVGLAKGSDSLGTGIIGVAGATINDKAGGRAWGIYSDLQHETGALHTYGIEVAAKNKSTDNLTMGPYAQTYGVFGAWLVGGGDPLYGGSSINPSNAAIAVLKHDAAAYGWNRGIVIMADAITGTDGTIGATTNATAIAMARRHAIVWFAPDAVAGATIVSTVTDGDNAVVHQFIDNGVNWYGANGKQFLRASHVASGVNYPAMSDATTGNPPFLSALGDDTNIDLQLSPKGTGVIRFGTHAVIGAKTVTGYITIRDAGGTLRNLAVVS